MRLALASLALAALAACGPITTTAALRDADVAVDAARVAGAPQTSPYEFAAAEAYLHKARECSGRGEYEVAARYADRAIVLAKEARRNAAAAPGKDREPAP